MMLTAGSDRRADTELPRRPSNLDKRTDFLEVAFYHTNSRKYTLMHGMAGNRHESLRGPRSKRQVAFHHFLELAVRQIGLGFD